MSAINCFNLFYAFLHKAELYILINSLFQMVRILEYKITVSNSSTSPYAETCWVWVLVGIKVKQHH